MPGDAGKREGILRCRGRGWPAGQNRQEVVEVQDMPALAGCGSGTPGRCSSMSGHVWGTGHERVG